MQALQKSDNAAVDQLEMIRFELPECRSGKVEEIVFVQPLPDMIDATVPRGEFPIGIRAADQLDLATELTNVIDRQRIVDHQHVVFHVGHLPREHRPQILPRGRILGRAVPGQERKNPKLGRVHGRALTNAFQS